MNKEKILDGLRKLISFESVSTDKKRFNEVLKTAFFIRDYLKNLGFKINFYEKKGFPPLIIAQKFVNQKAKTLGFYAHYDVQPEDPLNEWKSPPFKLTLKNGRFYARGIADDKGHLWQIITSAENLIQKNQLKNNLVFIFEGEEEIGSLNFEALVKKVKELRKVDVFYLVDVGMKNRKNPEIFYGLRGIIAYELILKFHQSDLHSGVYGNLVLNPAQVLSELMAKMVDSETHKIKIPKFYQDVKKISFKERKLLQKSNPGSLVSKILPSLDINGLISGYTFEGIKTIIPKSAKVKFSVRLVPNQNWKKIDKLVKNFIKKNLASKKYQLKTLSGSNPFYTDFRNKEVENVAQVLKKVFGGKVFYNRSGGSVRSDELLQRLFKKPTILFGFIIDKECNLHAPNENYDEKNFWKGIEALEKIMNQ